MKIQLQNIVSRKASSKCFICSAARFYHIPLMSFLLMRCRDTEGKCDFSKFYNDKIFNL